MIEDGHSVFLSTTHHLRWHLLQPTKQNVTLLLLLQSVCWGCHTCKMPSFCTKSRNEPTDYTHVHYAKPRDNTLLHVESCCCTPTVKTTRVSPFVNNSPWELHRVENGRSVLLPTIHHFQWYLLQPTKNCYITAATTTTISLLRLAYM